jgi:hypothetical protein
MKSSKIIKFVMFGFGAGIVVLAGLFAASRIKASTVDGFDPLPYVTCDMRGHGGGCGPFVTTVPLVETHQLYEANFKGHLEGHGSFGPDGGKGGANGCMSSAPIMWTGSCHVLVYKDVAGNVGEGSRDFDITLYNQIDYYYTAHYWIVELYANDATWYSVELRNKGRRVEVQDFSSDKYFVNACEPFNLSWETDWSNKTEMFWDGVVGTGYNGDMPNDYSGDVWSSCSPGMAYFTIKASGPGGIGYISVEKDVQVEVRALPGSPPGNFSLLSTGCFDWPSSKIEINWERADGATGYKIERRINNGSWQFLTDSYDADGPDAFDFVDSFVFEGNTYDYRVIATNANGSTTSANILGLLVNAQNCSTEGIIVVISDNPLGAWSVSGPSPFNGTGIGTFTYPNRTVGEYFISSTPLSGYTATATPTNGTLTAGGTLVFNVNYVLQTGTVRIKASIPSGLWSIKNSIGQPSGTGSGDVYVEYILPAGDYTLTANDVYGYEVVGPNPRLMPVPPGSVNNITIDYQPITLKPPTNVKADNSQCERLVVSWDDNSDYESSYSVWRREASSATFVRVSPLLAPGTESYTDPSSNPPQTLPVPDKQYVYKIRLASNIPFYREVDSAESAVVFNIACRPIITVEHSIIYVLTDPYDAASAEPYQSSRTINSADVLRMQITISNTGTAPATIGSIIDSLSANLLKPPTGSASNPWNVKIDKTGTGMFVDGSVSGTLPNITINNPGGWGTKQTGSPNWVIKFDTLVAPLSNDSYEELFSRACAQYSYSGESGQACGYVGPLLIKTGKSGAPNFIEVEP